MSTGLNKEAEKVIAQAGGQPDFRKDVAIPKERVRPTPPDLARGHLSGVRITVSLKKQPTGK
jgi:hypothetical protein